MTNQLADILYNWWFELTEDSKAKGNDGGDKKKTYLHLSE